MLIPKYLSLTGGEEEGTPCASACVYTAPRGLYGTPVLLGLCYIRRRRRTRRRQQNRPTVSGPWTSPLTQVLLRNNDIYADFSPGDIVFPEAEGSVGPAEEIFAFRCEVDENASQLCRLLNRKDGSF